MNVGAWLCWSMNFADVENATIAGPISTSLLYCHISQPTIRSLHKGIYQDKPLQIVLNLLDATRSEHVQRYKTYNQQKKKVNFSPILHISVIPHHACSGSHMCQPLLYHA